MVETGPGERRTAVEAGRTPRFTKLALISVLAVTAALLAVYALADGGGGRDARTTGVVLTVLTVLFALRVGGQILVRERGPRFLPPTEDWNLMPYRLLLPIQGAFLVVMGLVCAHLVRERGFLAEPAPTFGRVAVWFSFVYAGAMVVRYVVRMTRRPAQRWFGGTIPIVFHLVLASFVFVFGSFHASY
jgi:hypothetical protein